MRVHNFDFKNKENMNEVDWGGGVILLYAYKDVLNKLLNNSVIWPIRFHVCKINLILSTQESNLFLKIISTWCKRCPSFYSLYEKYPNTDFFSGLYLPVFGLNTMINALNLSIQCKCGKIWTRKNKILMETKIKETRSSFKFD